MISSFFYMFYNRDFNSIKVRLEQDLERIRGNLLDISIP